MGNEFSKNENGMFQMHIPYDVLGLIYSFLEWDDIHAYVANVSRQCKIMAFANFRPGDVWFVPWKIDDEFLQYYVSIMNKDSDKVQISLSLKNCCGITDSGLEHLRQLSNNVVTLKLISNSEITDKGLQSISHLTKIQTLNICSCDRLTEAGLSAITPLVNIKKLKLNVYRRLTDRGLASYVAPLPKLEELHIDNCFGVTREAAAKLEADKKLKKLIRRKTHCGPLTL